MESQLGDFHHEKCARIKNATQVQVNNTTLRCAALRVLIITAAADFVEGPQSHIYCWYKQSPCSKANNSNNKIINPGYLYLLKFFVLFGTYIVDKHSPPDSVFGTRLCLTPLNTNSTSSVITILHQMFLVRPCFFSPRGVHLSAIFADMDLTHLKSIPKPSQESVFPLSTSKCKFVL